MLLCPPRIIERGAMIVRSMPAAIRLAGPFVLRKLADEGRLEVFIHASSGGFYFRRREVDRQLKAV